MIEVIEQMLASHRGYRWKFFRAGGVDQVAFRTGTDLANLEALDQKLWVALSCPVRGIDLDPKTLAIIDTDKDGRIRVGELLAAVKWAVGQLKNPDSLLAGAPDLPLSVINDQTEPGAILLTAARRVLANHGKPGAESITLADVADTRKIFDQTKYNGDGIVPVHAAEDPETQKVIEEIITSLGGLEDRSGKPGINLVKVEAFFTQARAFSDWAGQAESDQTILPLGKATGPAAEAVKAVRAKIEDYFARCRLAAFDPRSAGPLNRAIEEYVALATRDLTLQAEEIARLPLARVEPGCSLPLKTDLNPAWAGAMARFAADAVEPLLGQPRETLVEAQWAGIKARLAPYETWLAAKPVTVVEKLGLERVRALLAGPVRTTLERLIQQDAALEVEYAQIHSLDKLIRLHRDLKRLAHNFVNFSEFYDPKRPACFQIGRLYMDGRACDLCFHVDDLAKHSTLAGQSKIYLAYCELARAATGEKRTICAGFTAGSAETLWVGRNGIFYDLKGNEWDAVIMKVVESPISLKEAFWQPWKKIVAVISEQLNKLLASKQEAMVAAAAKGVETAVKQPPGAKPAPGQPAMQGAAVASSIAAIGIAVGLLSQGVAKLFDVTQNIELWQAILGVAAVILSVSGPSVIIAYFKMRKRDIGPILNACGWAVNSHLRMTLRLGALLTQEAEVPFSIERQLVDPFAEDNRLRNLVITLCLLFGLVYGLWKFDFLNHYLPPQLQHRKAVAIKVEGDTLTVPVPAPQK